MQASSTGFKPNERLNTSFSNQYVPGFVPGATDALHKLLTRPQGPKIDLTFGNPHQIADSKLVECFKKWTEPQHPRWFAYTTSLPSAAEAVATRLDRFTKASPNLLEHKPWSTSRIVINTGAVTGLSCALQSVLNPGDECIYFTPKWFWYQAMIAMPGAVGVPLALRGPSFNLDSEAIAKAITPRTRAVLINTPHNPTGRVVSATELASVASVLAAKMKEYGHPIWIIHDAPYMDLVFDNQPMVMPSSFHPNTIITYSLGKVLLIPGNRIGFLAVSPHVADEDADLLMPTLQRAHFVSWSYANSPLQYALPDLLSLPSPVPELQAKRDFIVDALRKIGYDLKSPEGTFYVWIQSPGGVDDVTFAIYLADKHEVAVLPGTAKAMKGYFRITLSATMAELQGTVEPFRDAFRHFTKAKL